MCIQRHMPTDSDEEGQQCLEHNATTLRVYIQRYSVKIGRHEECYTPHPLLAAVSNVTRDSLRNSPHFVAALQ
jgi:hypothetical protein